MMKETRKIKGYLFVVLFLLVSVFLIINVITYLQNQKLLDQALINGKVYSLGNELEKAKKVNEIVYLTGNGKKTAKNTIFCRTEEIIKNGGACGEKVFLEVSMLRLLGIDSYPLGLCKSRNVDDFSHVVVEANINNKWVILDPSFNSSFSRPKDELKDPVVFAKYREQIKNNTGLDYPKKYDFDDTAYFRYGILGPFKNIGLSISRALSKFGLSIHQYYFMIRCELRNIVILLLALFIMFIFGFVKIQLRPLRIRFQYLGK